MFVVVTNLVVSTNTVLATGAAAEPEPFGVLWWKEGLNYRLIHQIELGRTNQNGVPMVNEQLSMSGRFGIKGAFDAAAFASTRGQDPVANAGEVRTARFYTTGDFTWRFPTYFKLELGAVSQSFYLHEAYLRFKEVPWIKNLTIGYIGAPLTMENLMAFGDLTFMEAAAPAQAFGPGNRTALQVDGNWLDERMSYQAGFYGTGLDPSFNFGDASQELARGMVRVTALPFYEDKEEDFRLLHLGAAVSYVFSDSSDIRYQARPESHLAPFLVDTGDVHAQNATQLGLEAAYVRGPYSLQAEVTGSWISDATTGTRTEGRTFWGAYVAGSWFLTGEHRVYDKSGGVFGRLAPRESLDLSGSHWGALEVGTRLSYLTLNDGPIRGGRMFEFMPGLNWYWSKHVRLQANYGWARVQEGPHPGDLHLFQTRLQVFY
jgi:phosphate-selective porin OprO/OprP